MLLYFPLLLPNEFCIGNPAADVLPLLEHIVEHLELTISLNKQRDNLFIISTIFIFTIAFFLHPIIIYIIWKYFNLIILLILNIVLLLEFIQLS